MHAALFWLAEVTKVCPFEIKPGHLAWLSNSTYWDVSTYEVYTLTNKDDKSSQQDTYSEDLAFSQKFN